MVSKNITSILTCSLLTYSLVLVLCIVFNLRPVVGTLQLTTVLFTLGGLPIIFATNGDFTLMLKLLSQNATPKQRQTRSKFQQVAIMIAYGVAIGAFLGSVYVPLDHEGFLQIWPVAPAIGAMGGFSIASLVGTLILLAQ